MSIAGIRWRMWCKPLMQRRDLGVEANLCTGRGCHTRHGRRYACCHSRLPAVQRKKVTASFDGGRLTSDGGVLLLSGADRQLGLCASAGLCDPRSSGAMARDAHLLEDILRARIFAIACGYPDADDLDDLRSDPAFKLACGRLPESGDDLASQPTVSRWENAPTCAPCCGWATR